MPMELAEDGGRILLLLADGRDISVDALGWLEDGGEWEFPRGGRALPYGGGR